MNIAAGMNRASSRIEVGTSGFLSISDIDFRVSAELEQESQASSYVEVRNSACLSSCSWAVTPLVELYLEPAAFSGGCNCCVSAPSCCDFIPGCHLKSCPGIKNYLEWMGKSVSFEMWHDPRGFLSSVNVRPASSLGAMGRSGSHSRQSRGIDPHVEIRRGEGAQIKLCRETWCSSRVRPVCQGAF